MGSGCLRKDQMCRLCCFVAVFFLFVLLLGKFGGEEGVMGSEEGCCVLLSHKTYAGRRNYIYTHTLTRSSL